MSQRTRLFLVVTAVVAGLGLVGWSIAARFEGCACGDSEGAGDPGGHVASAIADDPLTGAVLVDLDDGASSARVDAVERAIDLAIAPYAWPTGDAALGETLSADANLHRLRPPASEVGDVLRALGGLDGVEAVEVERAWSIPESRELGGVSAAATEATDDPRPGFRPNDPYYKHQWHLDQIQMPDAWTISRGRGTVVAVVDTGVLYRTSGRFVRAPDLAGTRFADGYDFIDNDAWPDDEHGHGTHCAGTIAQTTNNALGVAGVAPEAIVMPIRVLDRNGSGGWGGLAAGIRFAADHGANVISMSLGGGTPSKAVERAVEYAHRKGVTIVAAAGNAARARVEYPAAYPNVISVAAVRFDGELSFYSSYGAGLDIAAPGGDLRVDQNGDGMPDGVVQNTMVSGNPGRHDYLFWQGTSMATPHVAGVAALLHARGITSPDAIERTLEGTARGRGDTRKYGAGIVQAASALRAADQGSGALRGLAALGLMGLAFAGLRRRGKLAVGVVSTGVAALAVSGGLAVLPWDLVPFVGGVMGDAAEGAPGVLALASGRYLAVLALSALVPFGAVAVFLSNKRLLPLVVGTALGFAGYALIEALAPVLDLGLPALLAGPWLLLNAALAVGLARLAATKS